MGDIAKLAESTLDWWSLAGVDQDYAEAPVDWREAPPMVQRVASRLAETRAPAPIADLSRALSHLAPTPLASIDPDSLPDTLADFRKWLASAPDVPAAGPAAARIAPIGQEGAPLLVLTAMPDPIDLATDMLIGGEPGALLDRMLAAIDMSRERIGIVSMAVSPVPGGRIAAEDAAALIALTLHHIALARPKLVLVMGDKASRAILSTDVAKARGRLLEIKLKGAVMPAIATFHPRTLVRNAQFKRAAWESLQMVQKALADL